MITKQLLVNGYELHKNVFTPEEVKKASRILSSIFDKQPKFKGDRTNSPGIFEGTRQDPFNSYTELQFIITSEKLISALKRSLGNDIYLLPQMAAHKNGFPDWHRDTTRQEKEGHTFHYLSHYNVVNCGLYFQPNNLALGGGLDVIPESHVGPDPFITKSWYNKLPIIRRLYNQSLYKRLSKNGRTIFNDSSDFLIFDQRILHRATQPTERSRDKFSIFFMCSPDYQSARQYTDYFFSRPESVGLDQIQYRREFIEALEHAGLKLMI